MYKYSDRAGKTSFDGKLLFVPVGDTVYTFKMPSRFAAKNMDFKIRMKHKSKRAMGVIEAIILAAGGVLDNEQKQENLS